MRKVYVDISRCVACKTCEIACAVAHSPTRRRGVPISLDLYSAAAEADKSYKRVHLLNISNRYYPSITMPLQCRHCENPPCIAGCMVDAIYRDDEGRTLIRDDRCIGCRMCMMLCPYGAIDFGRELSKVVKCDLCPDEPTPACVASCPTKALMYLSDDELLELKRRKLSASLSESMASTAPIIIALG